MRPVFESNPWPGRRWRRLLQAVLIVAAGWYVYAPVFRGARVWDDKLDFPEERLAFDLSGLAKVWTGALDHDYYPIKVTVQWVQWRMWGDDMLGYHLTNVGLHLLSAFLLWWLLGKLGMRQAWLGGLLFAVHPLAVESVAWLTELKNVLSLPPLLAAMGAYINFDAARGDLAAGVRPRPWRYFALSVFWFVVAMLCKSSVVMFPAVILLYAWWRRGRVGLADLRASAVFFGISLILGLVEVGYQQRAIGGANLETGGLLSRAAVAGMAAAFYFFKGILPVGLMPVYPRWAVDPPGLVQFLPWIGFGALFGWLWRRYRGGGAWARHALFGLGFFLLNLVPVLGFVPMSYQLTSWVADRFAYLPLVGLVGLAAAAVQEGEVAERVRRSAISVAVAAVLAALAIASHRYAGIFRSDEALWTYTVQRNPNAWLAQNNLGISLANSGRFAEAVARFNLTLRLKPDYAEAHNNLGFALAKTGRRPEAMVEYREAFRLEPDFAEAHNNLGNSLTAVGRLPEALAEYWEALRLKPDYAEARNNFGFALAKTGRLPEALTEYREALRLRPAYAEARNNLGNALVAACRLPEAIRQYEEALRLSPDYAEAHNNLGAALVRAGRPSEGVGHLEQAVKLQPDYADARHNLVLVLRALGRNAEAQAYLEKAARPKADQSGGPR